MPNKQSRSDLAVFLVFLLVIIACKGDFQTGMPGQKNRSGMIEGKDYVVLKRARVLDEQGFDKPVEAMSLLIPNDWHYEGGVRWKSVNECRGEIVSWTATIKSPDGAIQISILPIRSFVSSEDSMTQQSLVTASQQGGCQVSPPFTAAQYLENLARKELKASVSNIRKDESLQAVLDKVSQMDNETSQQYGNNLSSSGSGVYGTLKWSDGNKGLAQIGVMNSISQSQNLYTGEPNGFSSTTVFYQVVLRYPPDREAEALKTFGTITTSHRMNPIWTKAKENFLTNLGNAEHAGRMERIRLVGEQSKAYAEEQSRASDARMRDWEKQQASSDANQHRFIQTIREVETWKDSGGNNVELSSGYKYGWSRPDGSYILTDNSLFNPAVEFQQNWEQMQKAPN